MCLAQVLPAMWGEHLHNQFAFLFLQCHHTTPHHTIEHNIVSDYSHVRTYVRTYIHTYIRTTVYRYMYPSYFQLYLVLTITLPVHGHLQCHLLCTRDLHTTICHHCQVTLIGCHYFISSLESETDLRLFAQRVQYLVRKHETFDCIQVSRQ